MPTAETDWGHEIQSMWDAFAGSTLFWVAGAVAVALAVGSLLRGGRRR
jgi:hypothetical protein